MSSHIDKQTYNPQLQREAIMRPPYTPYGSMARPDSSMNPLTLKIALALVPAVIFIAWIINGTLDPYGIFS